MIYYLQVRLIVKLLESVFENQINDFTVIVYNGEYPELLPEELKAKNNNGTENGTLKLNKTEKKIIEIITNNNIIICR